MKSRRRIYLIDPPFQIRFSIYVVTWTMALGATFPLIVQNLIDTLVKVLKVTMDGTSLEQIDALRADVTQQLWITAALSVFVIFIISIFVSHRIAGPLYNLRKHLAELAQGNLKQSLQFRKSDYFHQLARDYNYALEGIRGMVRKKEDTAQAALHRIEKILPQSGELQKELQEVAALLRQITGA
jgi:methyl-accepting chemotaxis protein